MKWFIDLKYKIEEFFDPSPEDKNETAEEYLRRIPSKYSIRYLKWYLATITDPDEYDINAVDDIYTKRDAKALKALHKLLLVTKIRFTQLLAEIENRS